MIPLKCYWQSIWIAGILFCSVFIWLSFQGSISPFITHTNPIHGSFKKPVYGFAQYYNGDLLHKENFYPLELMDVLKSGNPGKPGATRSFTDRRMFQAALGNILTLVLNAFYSLQILNLICFLINIYLIYKISFILFSSQTTGLLASTLYCFSPHTIMFVGDISPHLLGNTFSFLFTYLLLLLWGQRIKWRTLIGLSTLLGLWACSYPSAGFAAIVLIFQLLYKRQFVHTLAPVCAILLFPRLQLDLISTLGTTYGINKEAGYFLQGISDQIQLMQSSPLFYLENTVRAFVNFLFIENPISMFFSLIGLCLYKERFKIICYALLIVPLLVVMPVYTASSARAYIVTGIAAIILPFAAHSILRYTSFLKSLKSSNLDQFLTVSTSQLRTIVFIVSLFLIIFPFYLQLDSQVLLLIFLVLLASPLLFNLIKSSKPATRSSTKYLFLYFPLTLTVSAQILWGLAPAFQYVAPPFALSQGVFAPTYPFTFRANYLSMTSDDLQDIPSSLGGRRQWSEFVEGPAQKKRLGLFEGERPDFDTVRSRAKNVLWLHSLFCLLTITTLIALTSWPLNLMLACLSSLLMLCGAFLGKSPALVKALEIAFDQQIILVPGESIQGEIKLSDAFQNYTLSALSDNISAIDLYINVNKIRKAVFEFSLPDLQLDKRPDDDLGNNLSMPPSSYFKFLESNKGTLRYQLTVSGPAGASLRVGAWKLCDPAKGLNAWKFSATGDKSTLQVCPAFEIRFRDKALFFHHIGL